MDLKRIQPFIYENHITWTMTTNGYKLYTLNLIAWLTQVAKVPWTLCVICCDAESYTFFRREGIPCIPYEIQTSKGQQMISPFGSNDFAKWNRKKVELLLWFTRICPEAGVKKSLYLDGDIVVQKDPWAYLEGSSDLIFQCDCVGSEVHSNCKSICSGVLFQRHNGDPKIKELFMFDKTDWEAAERQDQPYIANRLAKLNIPFNTLDRGLFGNGQIQMAGLWKTQPWVLLHYNYRVGDTKKQAMRAAGHWRLLY
jgi:hypothetical protein